MTDKQFSKTGDTPAGTAIRTASQALAVVLTRQLMAGGYASGERLPTERDMARQYQVSRHVVREALKHLEALELIEIRQGSGVYANDVLTTSGMEIFEYMLFDDSGRFDHDAFQELLVFCRLFMPNVLRLAAQYRTEAHLDELRRALAERPALIHDADGINASNLRLLRCVSRASGNRVYQLIFNNIGRLIMRLRFIIPVAALAPVITQSDLEHMLHALETQDADLAGLLAQRYAERTQQVVAGFLAAADMGER